MSNKVVWIFIQALTVYGHAYRDWFRILEDNKELESGQSQLLGAFQQSSAGESREVAIGIRTVKQCTHPQCLIPLCRWGISRLPWYLLWWPPNTWSDPIQARSINLKKKKSEKKYKKSFFIFERFDLLWVDAVMQEAIFSNFVLSYLTEFKPNSIVSTPIHVKQIQPEIWGLQNTAWVNSQIWKWY